MYFFIFLHSVAWRSVSRAPRDRCMPREMSIVACIVCMCYCRLSVILFFFFSFALIAEHQASMQPGARARTVKSSLRSRIDPIVPPPREKNVALPISNLPIGPVSRKSESPRGRLERIGNRSCAAMNRCRETDSPRPADLGSVPRVICSVVELVVLNRLARFLRTKK